MHNNLNHYKKVSLGNLYYKSHSLTKELTIKCGEISIVTIWIV